MDVDLSSVPTRSLIEAIKERFDHSVLIGWTKGGDDTVGQIAVCTRGDEITTLGLLHLGSEQIMARLRD